MSTQGHISWGGFILCALSWSWSTNTQRKSLRIHSARKSLSSYLTCVPRVVSSEYSTFRHLHLIATFCLFTTATLDPSYGFGATPCALYQKSWTSSGWWKRRTSGELPDLRGRLQSCTFYKQYTSRTLKLIHLQAQDEPKTESETWPSEFNYKRTLACKGSKTVLLYILCTGTGDQVGCRSLFSRMADK